MKIDEKISMRLGSKAFCTLGPVLGLMDVGLHLGE